jgi:hypothetical protein
VRHVAPALGFSAGDTLFGAFWGRFGPVLGLTSSKTPHRPNAA